MPSGRVKFYDEEKGFGFIAGDDGQEVFLHASALPDGAQVKAGTRLEYGIADGKRGAQALSVRVVEAPVSLARQRRMKPDDMAAVVESLIQVLDGIGNDLRHGRYPSKSHGAKVAQALRRVADDLEA
ncbi:cold-shock protein [Gryllotalpicola reticulitermitis]|uniref:Cold-shock protein n=1 Tax=Gryllotalpicola reticulitermitis TaxID=1184153 RepID=A0ABV8Q4H0_9MICO